MPLIYLAEKLGLHLNEEQYKIGAGIIFIIGLYFLLTPAQFWFFPYVNWVVNSNQFGAVFALLGVITYARAS